MVHSPITLTNVTLSLPHKICFESFSTIIYPSSRIGITGPNGNGKTTLLKMLVQQTEPSSGNLHIPENTIIGYIPQAIENYENLSGGEKFNKALTKALKTNPNLLLLDEPTNHLDQRNNRSLLRMLKSYQNTLIIVTHDPEVLETCIDTLWYFDQEKITIFHGNYKDFLEERNLQRATTKKELLILKKQKKEIHQTLMKEQERAKKNKIQGKKSAKNQKWPTIISKQKAQTAANTSNKKKLAIEKNREEILDKLTNLKSPETIKPKFPLISHPSPEHTLLSIKDGRVGYSEPLIQDINLSLLSTERIKILGDNGSGKTTFIKAILNDPKIKKSGSWHTPKPSDIGYIDQHYMTFSPSKTTFEIMQEIAPNWSKEEIRDHLNNFLFRKNEEVYSLTSTLSGGEKARLSMACIAAKTPRLLILDEITNNLDLETREHVIQSLLDYPGAMIVISHDNLFLESIEFSAAYYIHAKTFIINF